MTEESSVPATPVGPPRRPVQDHRDAEVFVAEWMHWAGYKGARATQATGDGGLDVVAPQAAAQVKFGTRPVGRPAVQGLFGAARGDDRTGLFFSAGGYTHQAEQWATQVGVALFVLESDGEVRPYNLTAERIVRSAKGLPPARDPTPWIVGVAIAIVAGLALLGANEAGWFGFVIFGGLGVILVKMAFQLVKSLLMFRR